MKEEALIIPNRAAITQDNVRIHVVGVLYFRVVDPKKAAYGAGDPIFALSQLAQTTLRSILGEMTLDETFHERDKVNKRIVQTCNDASADWGMLCLRHEIREIIPPENVLHAMEMQVEAERRKRVEILQSEGKKQSEINTSEGHKIAQILTSEAKQQQHINEAIGAAEAVRLHAEADAKAILARANGAAEAIERLGLAVATPGGKDAVTFQVAIKYVEAFEKLAKNSTTLILPSNAADVASMISQATTIYGRLQSTGQNPPTESVPQEAARVVSEVAAAATPTAANPAATERKFSSTF
jgi:regulator of protease activity HflC (stomatin/prohibitin superfamily)